MFTALKKESEHMIIRLLNSAKMAVITLRVLKLVGYDNLNNVLYLSQGL